MAQTVTPSFRRLIMPDTRVGTWLLLALLTAAVVATTTFSGGLAWVRHVAVALTILQAVVLLFAAARPIAAGLVVVAISGVLLAIGSQPAAGLAPAAVFSAALMRPGRVSWLVLAPVVALSGLILVHGTGTDFLLSCASAIAAWSLGALLRSQRARRAEALRSELRRQRAVLAGDVHDIVGHSLAVIAVQSAAAEDCFERQPEQARAAMETIGNTARSALEEVRGAVAGIASPHDLADLAEVVTAAEAAGLTADLRVTGDPDSISEPVADAVFRIIRESVTNAVRHSGGDRIDVSVSCGPFVTAVVVRDNGPEGPGPGSPPGRGLRQLSDLAGQFGGTLRAGRERHGFVVRARLASVVQR